MSLDGEEKYTITQPITLSNAIKNLTIEGNGRIIDGNKQHSFLNIPQECKLTINKLTIQNCIPETTIDNDVTGAIITNGGKILLNNTKMINNTGKWGAALTVFNKPSQSEDAPETSLTVTDSIFESNYASAGGSAIYSVGCNVTVENTTFTKNFGLEEGALYYNGTANTTLNIRDSSFDSNGGTKEIYDELEDKTYNVTSNAGAAAIYSLGNATISNTEFKNNIGGDRGALYYQGHDYSTLTYVDSARVYRNQNWYTYYYYIKNEAYTNLTIENTNFTSNTGTNNTALSIYDGNVTINNVNFINNTLQSVDNVFEGEGLVIRSNSIVTINNSNFDRNGLPEDIDYENNKIYETYGSVIYQMKNNMTIDNCNFTSNTGGLHGMVIISDLGRMSPGTALESYERWITINEKKSLTINNTKLENNKAIISELITDFGPNVKTLEKIAPGVRNEFGDLTIDNTQFISNKMENKVGEGKYEEYETGIISFMWGAKEIEPETGDPYLCNVTNSLFKDNEPSNFIIKNNTIVLKEIDNGNFMTEEYIPNGGNATIYINDDETTAIQADLISEFTETTGPFGPNLSNIKIDYQFGEDAYKCKVILDQNELSEYYDYQSFYNNVYFFTIPHDYILTVEVNSPVELGNNATIKGKSYYPTSNGEIVSNNEEVLLYINDTYITSTTTVNGEYEFNYTTDALGTQNVTVILNKTSISLELMNKTTFDVIVQTIINLDANNTVIGNATTITGNLTDINNKTLPNANITVYVNNEKFDIKTNSDGTFNIPYTPTSLGNNYVLAFYHGNATHMETSNSIIFLTEKINTTTTATVTNKEKGNVTFNVKVEGKDGKTIKNGSIIVYDENGIAITSADINGEETTVTITDVTGGTYTFDIVYMGNDTYNPSADTKTVKIIPEANITINVLNNTEGNVTIEYTVTNGTDHITDSVTIVLPDGTSTTKTPDSEGKIIITDTTTPPGYYTTTATITTSDAYIGTSTTEELTILPDYQKTIDELKETNKDMNDTINEQKQTIDDLNNTAQKQKETNKDMNNTIKDLNNTVKEQKQTIKDLNDEINNLTKNTDDPKNTNDNPEEVKDFKDTIDKWNNTSIIKVVPENGTVDNNNVIVTLENKLTEPIANAPVKVVNSAGETIGTGKTDKEGIAVIPVNTRAGTEKVTVVYAGDKKHTPVNKTVSVTTVKNNVILTVDPVEGIIGETLN